MSVWYEIAMYPWQREKFAQQLGVPFRWLWYPYGFACEPCMYLPPCFANRFRMFKYTWIGHRPQESKHAGPWQTGRTGTVELLLEPVAPRVVRRIAARATCQDELKGGETMPTSTANSFSLYLACGTDRMARSISAWILELLSMAMWEMPTSPPRLMFESLP